MIERKMGPDPKNYDLDRLLTKIKHSDGTYPPELLSPRRQGYIDRMAEIGLGFGGAAGLQTTIKSGGKAGGFSWAAGVLLEAALVVAIVTEAVAAAYIYQDKITSLIQSTTSQPNIVEFTPPPETQFSPNPPGLPLIKPIEASPTSPIPVTPTVTVLPGTTTDNNNQGNEGIQGNSTPDPKGNNGNQYGLTPKPDRTKVPGGNNNNQNDNQDKQERQRQGQVTHIPKTGDTGLKKPVSFYVLLILAC